MMFVLVLSETVLVLDEPATNSYPAVHPLLANGRATALLSTGTKKTFYFATERLREAWRQVACCIKLQRGALANDLDVVQFGNVRK